MSSKNPTAIEAAHGKYAEFTVGDPRYRQALNAPFESENHITIEAYEAHQAAIRAIKDTLVQSLEDNPRETQTEMVWDVRRRMLAQKLAGVSFGAFESFLQGDGETKPSDLKISDLPDGEPLVVKTNSQIITASRSSEFQDKPRDFFDTTLHIIAQRLNDSESNVGPENYATALKFYADKYIGASVTGEQQQVAPDNSDVKALMDECLDGFFAIAEKDAPNFVEMTNLYAAIQALPKGVVDERFTEPILAYSLRNMDDYNPAILTLLLNTIAKIDIHEYGDAAAETVDLALRKGKQFETTRDFRIALRALASLPKGPKTDQALRTFFTVRNDLEQALDVEGAEEVVGRLLDIVKFGTEDAELTIMIKETAETSIVKASQAYDELIRYGQMTVAQVEQMGARLKSIVEKYKTM